MSVYANGKRLTLNPSDLIGKGGEADVYKIDPKTVLKLYKKQNDPDYIGNLDAQQGAIMRLKEHQHKLPDFPVGLPYNVVVPKALAYEKSATGTIVGYTMNYLDGLEVLLRLSDRQYREQGGIDGNKVIDLFRNLHFALRKVHAENVIIGDFNDLNILFDLTKDLTYLVDADSMQFGPYYCRTFTSRFLDPLLSDPSKLLLVQPHNQNSDWYAYAVMFFQSLLYVGPYGGVHKPAHGKRLQHDGRVLQRVTLFDPEVIYPKPAIPYDRLPDDLLNYFLDAFKNDRRIIFPEHFLQTLRWTTCVNCGSVHARSRCPECALPGQVKETTVIRGKVTAITEFKTNGQILHAVMQENRLRYLYHQNGEFFREGDRHVLKGGLDPKLRYRISRNRTLFGKGDRLVIVGDGLSVPITTGTVGELSIFDASDDHHFWIEGNQIRRSEELGDDYIGTILPGRTMFWTGKTYGFGFYQAGLISRAFIFNVKSQGINELTQLPPILGHLVDATCVSSDKLIWFMTTTEENGRLLNHCLVIDPNGTIVASESADHQTDESWLNSGIRGHFATGMSLYVATDDGIRRVATDPKSGTISIAESFPDTEPFTSVNSQLLPGPGGIYVISPHDITILRIEQ